VKGDEVAAMYAPVDNRRVAPNSTKKIVRRAFIELGPEATTKEHIRDEVVLAVLLLVHRGTKKNSIFQSLEATLGSVFPVGMPFS
jgi:hypothetical protein